AGADILGGVGQLECATVFSPVQAVLDDELGAMLRRTLRPPAVDADTLAFDEVAGMRPGGHFLDSLHTLRHCRSQHAPAVFLRQGRDDYEAANRRTALDAARERCLELARRPPPPGLPDTDTRAALRKLVRDADRHILDALDAGAGMAI
ncbi:MAG: trimethylamine methyltransferase family protein, partial [Planctomycetes bacterium]|nr:trimethylamine methyltransferase family protein [Planctomycetota bacterium]